MLRLAVQNADSRARILEVEVFMTNKANLFGSIEVPYRYAVAASCLARAGLQDHEGDALL